MLSPHVDPTQEQPDVLPCHLVELIAILRPREGIILESLYPKAESVRIPVNDLDNAPGLAAENIITAIEGAFGPEFLDYRAQAINLLSHIGESRPNEYPFVFRKNHDASYGSMVGANGHCRNTGRN